MKNPFHHSSLVLCTTFNPRARYESHHGHVRFPESTLPTPYGGQTAHAPNFQRLAERSCTFDTSYVCSMPCMPARRDFHTGRPNFLHRSWGPLEPFDDSVPEMLRNNGIHTHLITDHYHYFEDGGGNYHNRYSTWEFFRGQEGDLWTPDPDTFPQGRSFDAGLEFLRRHKDHDNWFLQLESFDPHEPFCADDTFRERYQDRRLGDDVIFDWPLYRPVGESESAMEHLRAEYCALLTMCDHHLGRILDTMDEHNMWEDTLLIVWTDHGFLLGEHGAAAKCWCPFYEEVAHTPPSLSGIPAPDMQENAAKAWFSPPSTSAPPANAHEGSRRSG